MTTENHTLSGRPRPDVLREPTSFELAMLRGFMQKRTGEVYAGTVPWAVVQRRRARNRMARASRRVNRGQR